MIDPPFDILLVHYEVLMMIAIIFYYLYYFRLFLKTQISYKSEFCCKILIRVLFREGHTMYCTCMLLLKLCVPPPTKNYSIVLASLAKFYILHVHVCMQSN